MQPDPSHPGMDDPSLPDEEAERRRDAPEQAGIIPGEIPGRPKTPSDPRFPGSMPDLA